MLPHELISMCDYGSLGIEHIEFLYNAASHEFDERAAKDVVNDSSWWEVDVLFDIYSIHEGTVS